MRHFENPSHPWVAHMLKNGKLPLQSVLKRVRNEGPLTAKDFDRPGTKKGGVWGKPKPAKLALELLFWRGQLMISERRNFHKAYDITERVLPDNVDTSFPRKKEMARFIIKRGLTARG